MKKLFSLVLMLATVLVISAAASCFAMQFSQPVKIGASSCNHNMGGGHYIEGATKINASQYYNTSKKRYTGYDKGYATFDGGNLYIHYDGATVGKVRVGASDKSNTIQTTCGPIYRINTDRGITLYLLPGEDEGIAFTLIGKREDGRYVKYVDGDAIYRTYYNQYYSFLNTFEVKGDSIIVRYGISDAINNIPELIVKLKWDEAAKWFSYERIDSTQKQNYVENNQSENVSPQQQTDTYSHSKKEIADALILAVTGNGVTYDQVSKYFCKKMKEQVTAEKFALLKEGISSHIGGTIKNISFVGSHKQDGMVKGYSGVETLFYIGTTTDNKTARMMVEFTEEGGTSKVMGVGLLP